MGRNGFQYYSPLGMLFSVIYLIGSLKLENLYTRTTFLWHHQIWRHNMTFWHFFTLKMINTPIQGSVQSLVRKCAKSANLPWMTDFKVIWPQRDKLYYFILVQKVQWLLLNTDSNLLISSNIWNNSSLMRKYIGMDFRT